MTPPGHSPRLVDVMTPFPYTVRPDESLTLAKKMMEEFGVRHLPVKSDNDLVGLITDRDIKAIHSVSQDNALHVSDASIPDPYIVDINTPLLEVLSEMEKSHIGCVLTTKNGHLAGIVTTVDVCRVLKEYIQDESGPDPDEGRAA